VLAIARGVTELFMRSPFVVDRLDRKAANRLTDRDPDKQYYHFILTVLYGTNEAPDAADSSFSVIGRSATFS
jgi:hypothetical protein